MRVNPNFEPDLVNGIDQSEQSLQTRHRVFQVFDSSGHLVIMSKIALISVVDLKIPLISSHEALWCQKGHI